ncbi:MAG TPA: large conductance mechanosensitive channel protein MscL [Candidatus Saccharimonadales bacterium]|nr:large conductance mechanosensitive channel protein MscL [Candidatus Saccharimonadales bacterium]
MKEPKIPLKELPIKQPKILQEFQKFVLRGNVVDLAVAVVVGAAFSGLVQAFVKDFLNPLVGKVQGKAELADQTLYFHGMTFMWGDFLNNLVSFLLISAVVFFFVVQPINHLTELTRKREPTPDPTTRKCPECLSEVPIKARRCMHCTSQLPAVEPKKAPSKGPATQQA